MIAAIPLTILPLIAFNLIAFNLVGPGGLDPWNAEVFAITMISGARWSIPLGDLLIVFAIAMLFFEVLKAARASSRAIYNHMASTLVLLLYVIEFITIRPAAHSVFFILTIIALFDVVAGFSVTIRTATRDVNFGGGA
jgi:uncharacterized membrane protein